MATDHFKPVAGVAFSESHRQSLHDGRGNALRNPPPVEDFMSAEPDAGDVDAPDAFDGDEFDAFDE